MNYINIVKKASERTNSFSDSKHVGSFRTVARSISLNKTLFIEPLKLWLYLAFYFDVISDVLDLASHFLDVTTKKVGWKLTSSILDSSRSRKIGATSGQSLAIVQFLVSFTPRFEIFDNVRLGRQGTRCCEKQTHSKQLRITSEVCKIVLKALVDESWCRLWKIDISPPDEKHESESYSPHQHEV